jgi:hypothetical protein
VAIVTYLVCRDVGYGADRHCRAIVAGFIASLVSILAFAVVSAGAWLMLQLNVADRSYMHFWLQALGANELFDWTRPAFSQLLALYLVGGLAAALVYSELVASPARGSVWQRGLAFSLAPNLVNLVIVLPVLGAGPLGLQSGSGPLPLVGSTVLSGIFGLVLAALAGPLAQPVHGLSDSQPQEAAIETAAANGIVVGLAIGSVVGLCTAFWPGAAALAQGAAGLTVGGAMCGAALGAVLGSFVGLSAEPDRVG